MELHSLTWNQHSLATDISNRYYQTKDPGSAPLIVQKHFTKANTHSSISLNKQTKKLSKKPPQALGTEAAMTVKATIKLHELGVKGLSWKDPVADYDKSW